MLLAAWFLYSAHCPKNILNVRIQIKTVTAEADTTVYVRFCLQLSAPEAGCKYTVASAPAVTGSVFMPRFSLFWDSVLSLLMTNLKRKTV